MILALRGSPRARISVDRGYLREGLSGGTGRSNTTREARHVAFPIMARFVCGAEKSGFSRYSNRLPENNRNKNKHTAHKIWQARRRSARRKGKIVGSQNGKTTRIPKRSQNIRVIMGNGSGSAARENLAPVKATDIPQIRALKSRTLREVNDITVWSVGMRYDMAACFACISVAIRMLMSSSQVRQEEILMRKAILPCQSVCPNQTLPDD